MGDKLNREEYFASGAAGFNYNNVIDMVLHDYITNKYMPSWLEYHGSVCKIMQTFPVKPFLERANTNIYKPCPIPPTGSADSASGGSGGSGMECMQLRSPPGPFHYLISEQAKSLVALQELQNEVGALLEFRDLVIETFPNLRSKMAPSTPASSRREWEPGVRVRRKLAGGEARAKPQPSVQDSGFSTETSCGKDAHSSPASAAGATARSRPLEDELWALLDVIQRKGVRLRDEAELLRGELDDRHLADTAEESFARALSGAGVGCGGCAELRRLRGERDALLAEAAALAAAAGAAGAASPRTPLGRLDRALDTPARPPRVSTPDSKKFAAILLESNPVELQRQLLCSTVHNQLLAERLKRAADHRSKLLTKMESVREHNEVLKFRLEEKNIELEGTRTRLRRLEKARFGSCESLERGRAHGSMRDMQPLALPDADERPAEAPRTPQTPRRRPSRIPLHTGKGAAPRPPAAPACAPPRPPSAHSVRSARSGGGASLRARPRDAPAPAPPAPAAATPRRPPDTKKTRQAETQRWEEANGSLDATSACVTSAEVTSLQTGLVAEYVRRTERLAPLFPRLHSPRTPVSRPLPADILTQYRLAYETPQNLALELSKSILYENADSIDVKNLESMNSHGDDSLWNGRPQQYFESMNYSRPDDEARDCDADSLAA